MDQEETWYPEIRTELELPKYQWWFDALAANDSICVRDTLSKSTKQRRDELVNNRFTLTKGSVIRGRVLIHLTAVYFK